MSEPDNNWSETHAESEGYNGNNESYSDDSCKIFISRIPAHFDEATVKRLVEDRLGEGSVAELALARDKEENSHLDRSEEKDKTNDTPLEASKIKAVDQQHRGFGFVTLDTPERQKEAIQLGTVRGGAKTTSIKKHTLYLRPIQRDDIAVDDGDPLKQVCYLWAAFRCPYGDECKFSHEGVGGCMNKEPSKKKQKCFAFKKGKCKLGDKCPYYHDLSAEAGESEKHEPRKDTPKSEKHCITWKKKGKCRNGDKCPYLHDDVLQKKALEKKNKRNSMDESGKSRQPLSIRVFGLNYDTTEEDVRTFFEHCGKIVEITFPLFEDSGRSKGFCGVLFQSPKAVAKAVELNGEELQGRWLSIQPGKMYLRQWEEQQKSQQEAATSGGANESQQEAPLIGEFGQKVKKRRIHGHKD